MSFQRRPHLFAIAIFLSLGIETHAKTFKNSFLQFEMPENWTCVLAGTEWICNPSAKSESREAVLVIAAKAVGPEDTFEVFQKNLKTPRTIQSRVGTPVKSQVLQVKDTRIQGQRWLEALHMSSEIEDFYTRYLVTVKEQLSILVSLTCQKTLFTKYSTVFSQILPTIKITASAQTLKSPLPAIQNTTGDIPPIAIAPLPPPEPTGVSRERPWLFYVLIALSGVVLVLFIATLKGDGKRQKRRLK